MQPIRFTLASWLGLLIVAATVAVVWNFIPAICWALIVTIVVWPAFRYWNHVLHNHRRWAAISLTLVVALLLIVPIYSVLRLLVEEGQVFLLFLRHLDQQGVAIPEWLQHLPFSAQLTLFWKKNLLQPGVSDVLLQSFQVPIHSAGMWLAQIGSSLASGFSTLLFTLIFVFFFLCEGERLLRDVNALGQKYLSTHWATYWEQLSRAAVATVNGTIMLGVGLGFLMGLVYWLIDLPGPALAGCLTAILAMVPFGAVLMFLVMAVIAWVNVGMAAAVIVFLVGVILNLLADHVVRPMVIGSSTQLSFLAILFGILGGVSLMGLLGLFLGPMIMAMFLSLYRSLVQS